MLTVSGIQFSYNSHPTLLDVGFSLQQGQVLGVLGVNGAGKSTLLKCLNRVLKPRWGMGVSGKSGRASNGPAGCGQADGVCALAAFSHPPDRL